MDVEVELVGVDLEDVPVGVAFRVEQAGVPVNEEGCVPLLLFTCDEAAIVARHHG